MVRLNRGWRYWAFERKTGCDVEVGLSADGYGTEDEAKAAIAKLKNNEGI